MPAVKRLLLALLLLGCEPSPTADDAGPPGGDAATSDAGDQRRVEIGGGASEFLPYAEDAVVGVVRGPQGGGRTGGYHIWVGARTVGFRADQRIAYRWTLRLDGSAAAVCDAVPRGPECFSAVDRTFKPQPTSAGHVVFGQAAILEDCCRVVGQPIRVELSVTDADGARGSASLRVRASDLCPDPVTNANLCP